ncbi:MAG: hypothetical protein JW951_06945, partial [Lentisphaerae bacterium]|nr:hypothetical protein [Lentisphaerota bacterium]
MKSNPGVQEAGRRPLRFASVVGLTVLLLVGPAAWLYGGEQSEGRARLRYSGVLGQSQPPGARPAGFTSAAGVAVDRQNRLWTCWGGVLYRFEPGADGAYALGFATNLPNPVVHYLGLLPDGSRERAFYAAYDGRVHRLDLDTGTVAAFCPARNAEGTYLRFGVAPDGAANSFAARAKLAQLDGNRVLGFDAAGRPLGVLLTLDPPPGGARGYGAVGFEPGSGDLLVASTHPDNLIYRFAAGRGEVTTEGWPRGASSANGGVIVTVNGTAWIAGGTIQEFPAVMTEEALTAPRDALLARVSGLVPAPGGGYWAATTQGLVKLDRLGRLTSRRLGGLSRIEHLALGPDGVLLGALPDGLCVRLRLDDPPDAPLRSENTPSWRTGQGYAGRVAGVCWDGALFLVADRAGERLWHFDPWHTAWKETPWIALTPEGRYPAPRALAVGDMRWWLLTETGLWTGSLAAPAAARRLELPAETGAGDLDAVAAADDGALYGIRGGAVVCFDLYDPAAPALRWTRDADTATALAATREAVF